MSVGLSREILQHLEGVIISFIYDRFWGQRWRGEGLPKDLLRSFSAAARRLSDGFTEGRRDLKLNYLQRPEGRTAYMLYFHLANVVRVHAAIEEAGKRGLIPNRPLRVLDVGAATAPGLWAMALAAKQMGRKLAYVEAWDQEKKVLADAVGLWKHAGEDFGRPPELKTKPIILSRLREGKEEGFDVILCSNVLNELAMVGNEMPFRTTERLLKSFLVEDGVMLLIEPALQTVSRALMDLRDQVVAGGKVDVPIPCGHVGPCPLRKEPRDWCHFEVPWDPPSIRQRIERALEHRSGPLKYSYLALKKGRGLSKPVNHRVISNPLSGPNGECVLICQPEKKIALYYDRKEPIGKWFRTEVGRGDLLKGELKGEVAPSKDNRYASGVVIDPKAEIVKI